MNRSTYFNFIEEKLTHLATRIEMRGGLNILDLNIQAENFYLHFFNLLFGWKLQNINIEHPNAEGIDLIDQTNKIIAQVSATASKQKIESTLAKNLSPYNGYSFKFIAISKDATNLQAKNFSTPHTLKFSPTNDIYDIRSILHLISTMDIEKQKNIYDLLKKELKIEPDFEKVESNLATIINILSKENWNQEVSSFETKPYDIDTKISYNQLDTAKVLIYDYKIHYSRIDKIYSDFDKQGINKSLSILDGIRAEYLMLNPTTLPDQCFFSIIEKVINKIRQSANYNPIPDEELALCVRILVVDAFIRCKIFKNPLGNSDVNS